MKKIITMIMLILVVNTVSATEVDVETLNKANILGDKLLAIDPPFETMKRAEQKTITVVFANREQTKGEFTIKVYPKKTDSDFRIATSPYAKSLSPNAKHISPVAILSTKYTEKGRHTFKVDLYKDNNVIASEEFIIEVKVSIFSRMIDWIKGLFA